MDVVDAKLILLSEAINELTTDRELYKKLHIDYLYRADITTSIVSIGNCLILSIPKQNLMSLNAGYPAAALEQYPGN